MVKCPICGHDGLIIDDNWGGKHVIRDPDTQLPHHCLSKRDSGFIRIAEKPYDDEWLCEDHGTPLRNWYCPIKDCPTKSRIRRSLYTRDHNHDSI